MKNLLSLFVLAFAVIALPSCQPKAEKAGEAVVVEEPSATAIEAARVERLARIERERAELAEIRRISLEEMIKTSTTYTNAKGKIVYYKAEVQPSYTGGEQAMNAFLQENVVFPSDAEDEGLEGTVFVDFVVDKEGYVTDVTADSYTYKNIDPAFTAEAIRVVKLMPRWTPGSQRGTAVDVKYSIPITFQMN